MSQDEPNGAADEVVTRQPDTMIPQLTAGDAAQRGRHELPADSPRPEIGR